MIQGFNFKEFYFTLTVSYVAVLNGVDVSFSAGIGKYINNIPLDVNQRSLIGSINRYSTSISTVIVIVFLNKIGKKNVVLLSLLFSAVSWMGMSFTCFSLEMIYGFRILGGIASGMRSVGMTYISETVHKNRRGQLLSIFGLAISVGIAVTYVMENLVSLQIVSITFTIFSILGFFQVCFFPETKYFYLMKNDTKGAQASILWFDSSLSTTEAEAEIHDILTTQKQNDNEESCFDLLRKKSILWAGILAVLILVFRTGAGRYPMTSYPQQFFGSFQLPVSFKTINITQGILELVTSILFTLIADYFQRRPMLQTCCWTMNALLLLVILLDFFEPSANAIKEWILLIALLVYYGIVVGFLVSITAVVACEVASSSSRTRGPIVSISWFVNDLLGAVYTEIFAVISTSVRIDYILMFFIANICLLSLMVYFTPETAGKKLHRCTDSEITEKETTNTSL